MTKHKTGRLEVVCGSMFSGKTEELIRRLRRAQIAKQKIQVFKPSLDYRYGVERITSHNGLFVEAQPVESPQQILELVEKDVPVIGIDEVQFFSDDITDVCQQLAEDGKRIITAGLDTDFRGQPFGPMPTLMAQAESVEKVRAICVVCGEEASRTQRLVDGQPAAYDDPVVVIGASETYEARCRHCHQVLPPRNSQLEA